MITAETYHKKGIKPCEEKSPLDILGKGALTTKEIADKLNECLPEGYKKITYQCAKQKLLRLEKKGEVTRAKVDGLIHWIKVETETRR